MNEIKLKYFFKKELSCRCCKLFNYDEMFLKKLDLFREMLKTMLIVTSGCRCIKRNHLVGGEKNSLHEGETKKTTAVDVTTLDVQKLWKVYEFAKQFGYFNEIIFYRKKKFLHLGFDKNQKSTYSKIID